MGFLISDRVPTLVGVHPGDSHLILGVAACQLQAVSADLQVAAAA